MLKIKQEPTTEEHLNETYAMVEVTRSGKPILLWSGGMHTAIKSFCKLQIASQAQCYKGF